MATNSAINNTLTGSITGSPSFSGSVTAATTLTATSGNIVATAGNLTLPNTNSAASQGVIEFGGNSFISNYGTNNTFIGQNTGNTTLTVAQAIENIGIGYAYPGGALSQLTVGYSNVCIGGGYSITNGYENTTVGNNCGLTISTGILNVVLGCAAYQNGNGQGNTIIGANIANQYTSNESFNTIVGAQGVTGDNNVLRIGFVANANKTNATYIAGITGTTVTGTAVLCSTAGQLGTVASSRKYKDNIQDMDDSSCIYDLKAKNFTMKNDPTKHRQWGFIAEDVEQINPDLVNYHHETNEIDSVRYLDLIPMLVNEIQKLQERIKVLEAK